MSKPLLFSRCQWSLSVLWLVGSGAIFGLFLLQLAGGKYGSDPTQAWGWLLPHVVPVLTTIAGAVTYQVSKPELKITVNPFAYRAAMALSTVYLGLLLGVLLLIPLAESRGTRPFEWFGQVQALITALASVATGVLGAFFVSSKPQP